MTPYINAKACFCINSVAEYGLLQSEALVVALVAQDSVNPSYLAGKEAVDG
jgi:hypothetical protein